MLSSGGIALGTLLLGFDAMLEVSSFSDLTEQDN